MSDLKSWSTLAASNNASVPNGWPEGMAPSGVNDSARELMGAVRRWYDDAQWTDLGHTPTYVSTLTFTLAGDKTGIYTVGRRIRAKVGSSTYYGTIDSSTYTAATGIYTSLDSGGFTASLSAIAVSILTPTNISIPRTSPVFDAITASSVTATVLKTDVISEQSAAAGLTIDGVLLKDSQVSTDVINELSAGAGVTVDGLLIKDGTIPGFFASAVDSATSDIGLVASTWTDTDMIYTVPSTGKYLVMATVSSDLTYVGAGVYNYARIKRKYNFPATTASASTTSSALFSSVVVGSSGGGTLKHSGTTHAVVTCSASDVIIIQTMYASTSGNATMLKDYCHANFVKLG